ncbi:MAG: hypothetical protein KF912_12565 [Phycisphaeraceae bacterium]|nr:hypothetical protein [Phycisphaeraceae bacterium]MBX3368137.1 hypothetical protein [Phycisphaeraceae bacterium]
MSSAVDHGLVERAFEGLLADLDFRIGLPGGFLTHDLPQENPDFSKPTTMHPLAVIGSPVALALVMISARPAYEDGSVMEWLRYLCAEQGLTIKTLMPGRIGPHPAMLVDGEQVQDETLLKFRIAGLEDGGRFVLVMAMSPDAIWPSFGEAMSRSIESFRLLRARGPAASLVPGTPVPTLQD